MCKTVYQAFDGKTFDTIEECEEYSNRPWVHVVTNGYGNIIDIFSTYDKANDFVFKAKTLADTIKNLSYSINSYVINFSEKVNPPRSLDDLKH